jgi:hypothetical protein
MSGAKLPPYRSTLSFGIARRHRLRDWLGRRAGESTDEEMMGMKKTRRGSSSYEREQQREIGAELLGLHY